MKTWFGSLAAALLLVVIGSYFWVHRNHIAAPATAEAAGDTPKYAEQEQAQKMVEVTGPLADYMTRTSDKIETVQPSSHQLAAADHVADSPVGSSVTLLHKTFSVASVTDVPFELPAHASTPQLRGTYRSYVQRRDGKLADEAGAENVEFVLLNDQQFADFLSGRPSDAIFSADAAPNQEINFSLPPTFGKPVKYYLVFQNSSRASGKKVVQADFRIDF
ncbi:MAG TPA: hypothetical protein VKV39_07505 [Candidatus Sulfotelmatobacter sp.]|nr:hypothetical protein [Candidatus Sulfotelmatobacter sp.]